MQKLNEPSAKPKQRKPDAVALDEALPRSFGRYVLFDHIGRGGMADIFLARMRNALGGSRNVVVKRILDHLSRDVDFSKMLTAEAKLAAKLNHANVVQVFDLGREGDRLFIAMEYVEGFDLNQMLRRLSKARIPLPAEFALLVIRETLRALDYAHRARDDEGRRLGIVHRDVSPSNVLISFEGEVKLCDFGIARALDAPSSDDVDQAQVQRTRVAGKSAYMSPEQASGLELDSRSDIFAAGILLWELCAGRRLYKGSDEQMLHMAMLGDVPPLPERGLPDQPALQAILDRALSKDPDDRYLTASEMLNDLEEYAIAHRLMASPLRFGSYLTDHFADEIVSLRRARERATEDMDDDAEWSSFGPSSAPPGVEHEEAKGPKNASSAPMKVPKAPGIPREALDLIDPKDAKDVTGSHAIITGPEPKRAGVALWGPVFLIMLSAGVVAYFLLR